MVSQSDPKTPDELQQMVDHVPHPSGRAHEEFLWGEAHETRQRKHATILPFLVVKRLSGIKVSLPNMIPPT